MGDLRYCFEQDKVVKTLKATKKKGLAVIDTEGISKSDIRSAISRGVFVYGYMNAGALEKGRPYYDAYSSLRIAAYDGWPGEYWVDVTARAWQTHLCDLAEDIRQTGAIGAYFDNPDIYYMAGHGFKGKAMRKSPSKEAVYKALANTINTIQQDIGLIVMPNGGEDFTKRFMRDYPGRIKTINQEGVLFEDFKRQPSKEKKYRTEWCDWARDHGAYVRIIEYPVEEPKTAKQKALYTARVAEIKAYCLKHRWGGVYVSKHTDLCGD